MGRKRKVVGHIAIAKEDKTSNACPNAMGAVNDENNVKQNSNGVVLLEKNSRVHKSVVRRSERLKNPVSPAWSPGVKPVVEHVDLVDSEEGEALHSQEINNLAVLREKNMERELQVKQVTTLPEVKQKSLEEKVDYLVRAVDESKSKALRQIFRRPNDSPSPDVNYKSLYIDSQKKIEALMEENYELVRKLEFARGKIAAYKLMKDATDASEKLIVVSNQGKSTEVAADISHHAVQKCTPADTDTDADDPKPNNNCKKKKSKR